MNIQEFIAESLTQIVEGVKQAQARTEASGAVINPMYRIFHSTEAAIASDETGGDVRAVRFDVAVTVEEGKGGKAGLKVWGLSAEGGKEARTSSASRVQFNVLVALPPGYSKKSSSVSR